jgi:hypothetical protein
VESDLNNVVCLSLSTFPGFRAACQISHLVIDTSDNMIDSCIQNEHGGCDGGLDWVNRRFQFVFNPRLLPKVNLITEWSINVCRVSQLWLFGTVLARASAWTADVSCPPAPKVSLEERSIRLFSAPVSYVAPI